MSEPKRAPLSRREILGAAALAALATPTIGNARSKSHGEAAAATFVLVHGAWHGGWCWQRVADRLIAQNHRVFAPTLTGVCERSHLSSPGINLSTQISDVVNEIRWKDLDRVVLVGHSYGGMVITGVAEQIGSRIASIVYLDAFIPADGQSVATMSGGLPDSEFFAPITAEQFAVNAADRAWVNSKMTPQSMACFTERLSVSGAYQRIAKKTYIRAGAFPMPIFDAALEAARKDPSWTTHSVDCGHDVMIDKPDELTNILVGASQG